MNPTERLDSYIAPVKCESDKQSATIHVVVQLPSIKLEPVTSEPERESRAIDEFDYEQTFDLQMALDVRNEYLHYEEPVATSIPGFVWLPKASELQQKDRVLEYLRAHLLMGVIDKSHFVVEDVSGDGDLLSVDDGRLPFGLRGITDMGLATKESMMLANLWTGIRMVIMVRQSIKSQHKAQIFAQLVAASLKAPDNGGVMALLTDLSEDWYFYWLDCFNSDNMLMHMRLSYPKNALLVVAAALNTDAGGSFSVPFYSEKLNIASVRALKPREHRLKRTRGY